MHRFDVPDVMTAREAEGRPMVTAIPARSLADLPVAGLTRRRIALLLGAMVAAWVIVLFAHQVGQAGGERRYLGSCGHLWGGAFDHSSLAFFAYFCVSGFRV